MFNLIENDFKNGKSLWNKGHHMMKDVRNKLSIDSISQEYQKLINNCITSSTISNTTIKKI